MGLIAVILGAVMAAAFGWQTMNHIREVLFFAGVAGLLWIWHLERRDRG
jgi:hypothetical protein